MENLLEFVRDIRYVNNVVYGNVPFVTEQAEGMGEKYAVFENPSEGFVQSWLEDLLGVDGDIFVVYFSFNPDLGNGCVWVEIHCSVGGE